MWRYKQPGFALRLLCELQKQQQCSLHCDTLLQTEGVSIPAHSCVLSALSPVFCRAFANVPLLPVGQSRLVQLEAVGAHALMKLVGFMYSGELEGQSLDEQQEVIDIAYRLGFGNFMVRKQEQVNRHRNKTASWRDIGMQTEETGGRIKDASVQILPEKRRFFHSGTQTDGVEAYFADTCIASEPELSIDLADELTDVPSEYYSISPDAGLAWIDKVVARSPSNSTEALVRVHTKCQRTQKEGKREKHSKKPEGTQISFKIKLKRQRSGALWEIVSVQGESTADGAGICGSCDATPMTHSVAELTHKSSVEVQLSSSPSLTCQNLETVTLTPPSELTTPLPATTTRLLSEHVSLHTPHPVPPSSPLQMPPLSPGLSQPKESDEHIAKLLEMVTVGLNIVPSVTEGNSSMYAQLEQRLETCAAAANSQASYLCLFGHNLGAMGSGTSSGTSEQKDAETEDLSGCRKWDLKNVQSVERYPTQFSHTSPCITQKKNIDVSFTSLSVTDIVPSKLTSGTEGLEHQNIVDLPNNTASNNIFWGADTYVQLEKQTVRDASEDCDQTRILKTTRSHAAQCDPIPVGKQWPEQFHVTDRVSVWQTSDIGQAPNSDHFSEMRLPVCLSPLISEAGQKTGISTQDSLGLLAFSSCLSTSNVNLQPTMRYTSPPIQPQALPGKTNQQISSCTSLHANDSHCSALGKNSCPLRRNRDHNGEASKWKSGEKKAQMPDFHNDLLKETEDRILDRQVYKSVVRETTARDNVETVNEPYRKKARVAGYPYGVDTQTKEVANPCSVKIKDFIHINSIQGISNPATSEKMDCLKAVKIKKTMPMEMKSQKNLALGQISQPFKCKGQEACQKDVWEANQPAPLVAKCGHARPLQKRTGTKALMGDVSKISKLGRSSAVLSASSFSSHHDLQVIQMNKECVPRHGTGSSPKVQQCILGHAQTTTKVKDLTNECEKSKIPEQEMEDSSVEPEKVILDMNQNRVENKEPQKYASVAKKTSLCDKIFHQSVYSVGTTVTQHSSINPHINPNFRTTNKKVPTTLPPSLTCKKLIEPPEPNDMNTKLMIDNSKQKDTTKKDDMETSVPQNDKPDDVSNNSKDKQLDSKSSRVGGDQVESSSGSVNGCLVNGSFVKEPEISASTGLFINEADLNASSYLCTFPPERDLNSKSGVDLQNESSFYRTLLYPFTPENLMEKPTTDESICPFFNESTEVKLIKTKDLHIEESKSTQIVHLEGQKNWKGGEEKKSTAQETEHEVEIGRKNEFKAGVNDIEVDVMDESAQLAIDHGDDVISTGGSDYDIDVEESQMSVEMNNDVEDTHEQELGGSQVLGTEVMPSDQAAVARTSEMINTEASSIQPDLSSSSVNTLGSSAVFLPDVNIESAEDRSSAEEELVVDEISDSPVQPCTVAGTHCNTNLKDENRLIKEEEEEEEEEEVDVTGD